MCRIQGLLVLWFIDINGFDILQIYQIELNSMLQQKKISAMTFRLIVFIKNQYKLKLAFINIGAKKKLCVFNMSLQHKKAFKNNFSFGIELNFVAVCQQRKCGTPLYKLLLARLPKIISHIYENVIKIVRTITRFHCCCQEMSPRM